MNLTNSLYYFVIEYADSETISSAFVSTVTSTNLSAFKKAFVSAVFIAYNSTISSAVVKAKCRAFYSRIFLNQ